MTIANTKLTCTAVAVLAMIVVAFAFSVTTASGWITLLSVTGVPLAIMWWSWNAPAQTLSESISEARR